MCDDLDNFGYEQSGWAHCVVFRKSSTGVWTRRVILKKTQLVKWLKLVQITLNCLKLSEFQCFLPIFSHFQPVQLVQLVQ